MIRRSKAAIGAAVLLAGLTFAITPPTSAASVSGPHRFINYVGTGDCLDAGALYGDPNDVYSVRCNSFSDPYLSHQQWFIVTTATPGLYLIKHSATGKCLYMSGGGKNGVYLSSCSEKVVNQRWKIENNHIRNAAYGYLLYDEAGTTDIRGAANPNPYNNSYWKQTAPGQ
ncbi:RICIN domain-containing protein [Nonomuraea sp. NPDC050328]|uniref:RICIN domain-containing protein n=1 Tax=Nonomuraea sp. NPDC050328 TaxID=3364361 RepID=UPI0037B8789A